MGGPKKNAQKHDAQQSRITDFFSVRLSPPSGVKARYMEPSSAAYFAPEKRPIANSASQVGPTHAVPYDGPRTVTTKRKLGLFDIHDLETPSTGIGADEEVLLPSGEFKKVRDLVVGDFVLNEVGRPVEVLRAPTIVDADAFEVTCNTANDDELRLPQEVLVGGLHRLEVTIHQLDSKIKTNERKGYKSSATQSFFELLALEKPGEWVISKPRKTRRSITFPEDGEHGARTKDEAVSKLAIELEKLEIPQFLSYYPQAYHLVHYEEPERGPQRYFYYATHLDTDVRKSITIPTGIVLENSGVFCRERRRMNELVRHFGPDEQQLVLYLAGLWIGGGYGNCPIINSKSVESMRQCAEIATRLGLYCDVTYHMCGGTYRERFSNFDEQKIVIELSNPQGMLETGVTELGLLHEIISVCRARAWEWCRNHEYDEEQVPLVPFNRLAAEINLYNGRSESGSWGGRNLTSGNWLWDVFKLMLNTRPDGEQVKAGVPLWLVTTPVAWREACLAGLIESKCHDEGGIYRCIIPSRELWQGAVSVARSLGIRAYFRTEFDEHSSCEGLIAFHEIEFEACDALARAMTSVASSCRLPQKLPGPDCFALPKPLKFTVTPKGRHELATGFEVEGHKFMLRNALVMLDCFADELDTAKRTEQVLIGDKCIARGCNDVLNKGYGPSWDTREGRLCATHWRWYKKAYMYCPVCKFVPPQLTVYESRQCDRTEGDERCPGVYVSVPPNNAYNTHVIRNSS